MELKEKRHLEIKAELITFNYFARDKLAKKTIFGAESGRFKIPFTILSWARRWSSNDNFQTLFVRLFFGRKFFGVFFAELNLHTHRCVRARMKLSFSNFSSAKKAQTTAERFYSSAQLKSRGFLLMKFIALAASCVSLPPIGPSLRFALFSVPLF